MSDALASQLARALNLPPDAAQHTLDHLVATLREQIDATGKARVPGLGTFLQSDEGLTFRPDDALARAVNHRYAGLRPIEAGARAKESETRAEPDDPFVEAVPPASSATGFQPLDAFVDPEEVEAGEPHAPEPAEPSSEGPTPQEEPEPDYPFEDADPFEDAEPIENATAIPTIPPESLLDETSTDEASEEPVEPESPDESDLLEEELLGEELLGEEVRADDEDADVTAEVWAPPPTDEDAIPEAEDAFEATPETGQYHEPLSETDADDADADDANVALVAAGLGAEADDVLEPTTEIERDPEPETEPEAHDTPPDAEPEPDTESEPDALDSLADLAIPDGAEDEADDEDEEATAILPVMTPPAESSVTQDPSTDSDSAPETSEAPPPEVPAVAPAVAATSREPVPSKAANTRERRGLPVVPIVIGLVAVLGVVALLWLLGRGPEAPPVADRPAPADTAETVAAAPPAAIDTTATDAPDVEPEPSEPAASADPLRSTDGIDRAAGGFSWVVGSELSREPAERRVAEFRAQGLRADVIAEEAAGRTRFRVALGQFESIEQAEQFRSDLPDGVPTDTWLLRL